MCLWSFEICINTLTVFVLCLYALLTIAGTCKRRESFSYLQSVEPESPLPCLQEPATFPDPDPDELNTRITLIFPQDPF
jgi:hypothetical protein